MEAQLLPWRHKRNLGTTGWDGLARLMRATAVVVGLGGLGGYVVEGLARMGVGHLVLDGRRRLRRAQLNRQLLSSSWTSGGPKPKSPASGCGQINSSVDVTIYDTFATAETLPRAAGRARTSWSIARISSRSA